MDDLFRSRPFKIRNAEEFELSTILNLYVNPINGLANPFDYENNIIKGRMGSGKTMYLRANHAYHLYGLVPSLIEKAPEVILPVFIRLSDFQHLKKPTDIYNAVIIKIIEELTSIYLDLEDRKKLAEIHRGVTYLSDEMLASHKLAVSIRQLTKLGAEEYVERVSTDLGLKGGVKSKFLELSAEYKETKFAEIKNKPSPGIKDVEECYKNLLEGQDGKILLLIDEAGSLDKTFFQQDQDNGSAFFEILMNQFRTASFIRTKIAVYPNSYSDMLTETRYGDAVRLEELVNTQKGYEVFRKRTVNLIENYFNPLSHEESGISASEVFTLSADGYNDCIEQIIYASGGNMRRLIQLLDLSMSQTYESSPTNLCVTKQFATEAIKKHAHDLETLFNSSEKDFLDNLVSVCKTRSTYKFKFPNMSPVIYKYTSRSRESNILNVEEVGTGRKGSIYSFDYAYSVFKDMPTHYISGSEKINRERSSKIGPWISRTTTISEEIIEQASQPGKVEGKIDYIHGGNGMILGDDNQVYFFLGNYIIESDRSKKLIVGQRVRFYPAKMDDSFAAFNVEILI